MTLPPLTDLLSYGGLGILIIVLLMIVKALWSRLIALETEQAKENQETIQMLRGLSEQYRAACAQNRGQPSSNPRQS